MLPKRLLWTAWMAGMLPGRALAGEGAGEWLSKVDWDAAGAEATEILAGYLRVDTTNPPGNETAGALYLQGVLARDGIASEIVEFAPGRGSLIARLPGSGAEPPLCLLSHIDVVTAEPSRWSQPPLSGAVVGGDLWGRGALDMKGMGALEVATLVQVERLGLPLRRDLVLLAVADEEDAGRGIDSMVAQWDRIGCSHVINEGGLGIEDLFFEGQTVFAISVGEKGATWVKMIASGEPGHGSTPAPGRAPERLARALDRLSRRKAEVHWSPELLETFRRAGRQGGGVKGAILQSPGLVKLLLRGMLLGKPPTRAVLTNTVNVTGFGGAQKPNVVPSETWAVLDCRTLPGQDPQALLAELAALVDDPQVRFEVMSSSRGSLSPADDPLFRALAARAVEGRDDAVAGPVLSVGYTDSNALRPLGVRAYGFVPVVVDAERLGTMHGDDERVRVSDLRDGLRILLSAVLDVSGGS